MDIQELKEMSKADMIAYLLERGAGGCLEKYNKKMLRDLIIDNLHRECEELHSEMQ